jgi:hypothetical protein
MCKVLLLLLLSFLDSGTEEKLVVTDYVDLIEINHKFHHNEDDDKIKRMFMQYIFWEYRDNVLLPEYKEGKKTGYWKQGSEYIVIDYLTVENMTYGIPVKKAVVSFLNGICEVHYYDTQDRCYRIVKSKNWRTTYTLYDPEVKNKDIVENDSRNQLTKPDRYVIVKDIPPEIEELLDMEVEVE